MRNTVRKAFTLVEILIVVVILGILAAIVVPQFTSASEDAQIGNVETQLQTIRQQIELYRVRHNGDYPTLGEYANENGWGDDTEDGLITVDYLRSQPVNPRTGNSDIVTTEPAVVASGDAGWCWVEDPDVPGKMDIYANGFDEANHAWMTADAEEPAP